MNIRLKLTLLLLAIALVPALVIGVVAYYGIGDQITQKTIEQLDGIATKQTNKLNALLRSKQNTISQEAYKFDLQHAINDYLTVGEGASGAKIAQVLQPIVAEDDTIDEAHVVASDGKVLASTVVGFEDKIMPMAFLASKQPKQVALAVHEDPRDELIKLYAVLLLPGHEDSPVFLVMNFNLKDIIDVLQDYGGLGASGETVLAEKDDSGKAVSLFALRFDSNAALKTNLDSLKLFDSAGTYADLVDYRQHDVIVATNHIQFADWAMATKIDRDEALAPILNLRNTLITIYAVSILAIVLLAFYLGRAYTAPIILISEKTKQIMKGDFSQRINITSNDEIGRLATNFNLMTDELSALYRDLEHKVEERTAALNMKVQELGNAKAKDEAIITSMGDGMIATDSGGLVMLMNDIAATLLGVSKQQLVGRSITEHQLYQAVTTLGNIESDPVHTALTTGRKVVQDVHPTVAGGDRVALNLSITPVIQQGRTVGTIMIIRDVTKEREVDRMKTEFISLASHQLRTPLSAIKWFGEMLIAGDAGKLTDEQLEFARNIYESTERMTALVNSLLNISRIESGRIIVEPQPTDLKQLVQGIVSDLGTKTQERHQTLIVSVHDSLPKVNLDPRLIGQVYLNLLTNAIKYTPKGGEVTVIVSQKDGMLLSQVSDNGYGIPLADQKRVFQKFFRAENVTKVVTDGTGLGLYLIKAIVESSGGKIWFKSEENKGTTFWFSLPMTGMKAKAGEVTLDA